MLLGIVPVFEVEWTRPNSLLLKNKTGPEKTEIGHHEDLASTNGLDQRYDWPSGTPRLVNFPIAMQGKKPSRHWAAC